MKVTYVIALASPLRNIYEKHCCTLVETFSNYRYIYARDMMTEYVSAASHLEGVTNTSTVHSIAEKMLLKDGYYMHSIDRYLRWHSMEAFIDADRPTK